MELPTYAQRLRANFQPRRYELELGFSIRGYFKWTRLARCAPSIMPGSCKVGYSPPINHLSHAPSSNSLRGRRTTLVRVSRCAISLVLNPLCAHCVSLRAFLSPSSLSDTSNSLSYSSPFGLLDQCRTCVQFEKQYKSLQ